MSARASVLALNAGSSSIKAGVYAAAAAGTTREPPVRLLTIEAERVGLADGRLRIRAGDGSDGVPASERAEAFPDFASALAAVFAALDERALTSSIVAVGHRIVHGGPRHARPARVTPAVRAALEEAVPLARNHMPQALAAIDYAAARLPGIPHVACFDTAFHRTLSPVARMFALPPDIAGPGIALERYGFHGLSYEYLCAELARLDPAAARGRIIVLHLGNGASMAAIRDGQSVDTTMGFTPTSGLVMSTRSGDVDPGVLMYLLRERGMTVAALEELLDKRAGLLGVSGTTADMRELLEREQGDPRAGAAIALFCHRARKYLGAYASVLEGIDTIVFSGGIGERSAAIRARICAGHEYLGVRLDAAANAEHAAVISSATGAVTVRVIRTDEESMIIRHTLSVLDAGTGGAAVDMKQSADG